METIWSLVAVFAAIDLLCVIGDAGSASPLQWERKRKRAKGTEREREKAKKKEKEKGRERTDALPVTDPMMRCVTCRCCLYTIELNRDVGV